MLSIDASPAYCGSTLAIWSLVWYCKKNECEQSARRSRNRTSNAHLKMAHVQVSSQGNVAGQSACLVAPTT